MSDQQMLDEHQKSWSGFVKLITWSTVSLVAILLLLLIFVA